MTEQSNARRIMFCCEECVDNYPEGCGYFDRNELRVMPNGKWLCASCFDECDARDYGVEERDEEGYFVKSNWTELPKPPALVRADLVEQMAEALRRSREAVNAVVLSTHSVSFDADLRAIDTALSTYAAAVGLKDTTP